MKIVTYKVPVTLTRNKKTGVVDMELHEDQKTKVGEEAIDRGPQMIPAIATELSTHNDTQRTLARSTMLVKEDESKVSVLFKYLE